MKRRKHGKDSLTLGGKGVVVNLRYGILRREFLKENYPLQYQILLSTNQLHLHLIRIAREAENMREILTAKIYPKSSSDFLTNLQAARVAENQVEEIILAEVVFRAPETIA